MPAARSATGPTGNGRGTRERARSAWTSCSPRRRVLVAEPGIRVVRRMAHAGDGDERAEVVRGLMASPARIAPKYFYDELGCALYGAICQLPEYYPTRTEREIFKQHRADIVRAA